MASHLQTTVSYHHNIGSNNNNNNVKSFCNLSHPCVYVNTSRPPSSLGGNLTPGSVTPGRCSTPVSVTPGRCSTPVSVTPGRCSTPVNIAPGRCSTPLSMTPGRCSTPVSMTPGRCTPVHIMSRKYYSDILAASTASTVAIDNKIEQAMDLVKSHLMFAVREEVDVLKEKIVELMDRINHLECENSLLRQYASPDVIQQLQTQLPHQMQQQQQPPHHSSTT